MSLQQPALKFPTVKAATPEDFFSGISMSPGKEVMDIVSKYTVDPEEIEKAEDGNPAVPPVPATAQPVEKFAEGTAEDIIKKYAAKTAEGAADGEPAEKGADKPKPPKAADAKPAEPAEEGGTAVVGTAEAGLADDIPYDKVANFLQESGIIIDIPADFPVDAVNKDNFFQLIEHNISRKVEEEFGNGYEAAKADIASKLTDDALDIVSFQLNNPNASEQDVRWHMERVLYAGSVSDLDPADAEDAEVIIRQYLSADSTPQEVEDEVAEAKERGRLEQKALLYKPKLERRAQEMVNQSRQRQEAILQADAARHGAFMAKIDNLLKGNTLLGVEIGQAEKAKIRAMFANNKMQVPIDGGRIVELGMIDFHIRKNMYTPEGDVERLALAALVLEDGPEALKKYVKAPAQKEVAIKFAAQKASGTFSASPAQQAPQDRPINLEDKRKAFFSRYVAQA